MSLLWSAIVATKANNPEVTVQFLQKKKPAEIQRYMMEVIVY
jgi:hypothetical protein